MSTRSGMAEQLRPVRVSTWSIVRGVLLVAATAVAVVLVDAAATTLWWIAISAVLAALLSPAILRLSRYVPRPLAITVVLLAAIAFSVFVVYRGLTEISDQVSQLRAEAVRVAGEYESSESYGQMASEFGLTDKMHGFFDGLPAYVGGGDTTGAVEAVTENVGGIAAIFFLLLLLVISGDRLVRGGMAQVLEGDARAQATALLSGAYRRVSRYMGLILARALAVGVLVNLIALGGGWKGGTVIALWFALWSVVPGVGLVVAVAPFCIALALSSPLGALVLFVAVLGIQYLLTRTFDRWMEGWSVRLGAALTLLAVSVGIELHGFGGALIAVYAAAFAVAVGHESKRYGQTLPEAVRAIQGSGG